MTLTLKDLNNHGLLQELAECFDTREAAFALLADLDLKTLSFRSFDSMSPIDWWRHVCQKLDKGLVQDGLEKLLQIAAKTFPGNTLFAPFKESSSDPDKRGNDRTNIVVSVPEDTPDDLLLECYQLAKRAAKTIGKGKNVEITLGTTGSSRIHLSIEDAQPEDVTQVKDEIVRLLRERGVQAQITQESYTFRDYYSDPLTAEGPDGQRFSLDHIRASTPVKDIARGVMNSYRDDVWPATKTGQRQQAVVDRVTPEGTVRLDPRQTLHDAGVRPGDTLQVSPERTAGAVDPLLREEALARVRVQVLDHAAANPGFEVEANSLVAPTEYLFRFRAPSFAPPPGSGESPRPIEQHEVLVELPPDFPIEAPRAWWQTEIFHPNIHPENGLVCLGALRENYQPGLDFGELCKMLVDIAAYRNYAFEEGYFNKAAAKWALSEEGQLAIEQAGGFSLLRRLVEAGQPQQPLRIRRIDQ